MSRKLQFRIDCKTCPEAWVEFEVDVNQHKIHVSHVKGQFPMDNIACQVLGREKVGHLMLRPYENISVKVEEDPCGAIEEA
jgi:hypothetical protein